MSNGRDSWKSPQAVIELAKLVLLILGGIWAFYLFVSFDRDERALRNEILRLQRKQEEHKTSVEESTVGQNTLKREDSLEVVDLGPYGDGDERLFFVNFSNSITNAGALPLEITYVAIEVYLGQVGALEMDRVYGLNSFDTPGPVHWQRRDARAWYFAPSAPDQAPPQVEAASGEILEAASGGGGTARLSSEETSRGGLALLVVARHTDWIGFDIKIGVDGGDKPEDRWTSTYQAGFFDAEPIRPMSRGVEIPSVEAEEP